VDRSLLYRIGEDSTAPDGTKIYGVSPDYRTDHEGMLVLESVEARALLLLVRHPEYLKAGTALSAEAREVTVPLRAGAWVRGEIRAGEMPLDDGSVKLSTLGGEYAGYASIEEGTYSLGPVAAGRYIAQVQLFRVPEEKSDLVFLPRQVEVPASGTVTLDFEAQRSGTSVEVLASEQLDEVILVPGAPSLPGAHDEVYKTFAFGHRNRAADREGHFRFRMLPAGRYTLFAVRDWQALDLELHREEVDVPAQETVSFTVHPRWRRLVSPPSE
jgi:hypothetical protein